jgi:hypothetical protein
MKHIISTSTKRFNALLQEEYAILSKKRLAMYRSIYERMKELCPTDSRLPRFAELLDGGESIELLQLIHYFIEGKE